MIASPTKAVQKCFHCGDDCSIHTILLEYKPFCCEGCKTVYQLLDQNGLCTYYDLEQYPGIKIKAKVQEKYAYLENSEIADHLLDFDEGGIVKVRLYLPTVHCSSCIWLLENMYKLEKGIISSRINFLKKEITMTYQKQEITLRKIVELLDSFGYPPSITLEQYNAQKETRKDNTLLYKIGVAGFCSGNIMLLSFPEYFGLDESISFRLLFGWLNLFLSLPVVFYCASDYFVSSYKGLKNKTISLDVPIAIGMAAILFRSIYEVVMGIGPGYFDSLTGLIFFLLIGKWFQQLTYHQFSFERDYQSYFPVAITQIIEGIEIPIPIKNIQEKDMIVVRNNEIVPADSRLLSTEACIDYSFVSGESIPIQKKKGDLVYAGGRQLGGSIHLEVQKKMSQSYLLQLWDQEVFKKSNDAYLSTFVIRFSRYFVFGTLLIAFFTVLYWSFLDSSKALFALTSVLLVACPCALALSLPFALGNSLRWLGKKGLFLKNADTVERLSDIDVIVFDKTGTLTETNAALVEDRDISLTGAELLLIKTATGNSFHPLSQAIYHHIPSNIHPDLVDYFEEIPSKGLICRVSGNEINIGSAEFLGQLDIKQPNQSSVHVSINEAYKGYFNIQNKYRATIFSLLEELGQHFDLHMVSGDNENEKMRLSAVFKKNNMAFNQSPSDKLHYVQRLMLDGKKVMMLGDGLNDAGALKAANIGIAVSEDTAGFSPACDGILEGGELGNLAQFVRYAHRTSLIIKASLILSLLYNVIGLYFAVRAELSPVIAAIIMPISSVTVVLFAVTATNWAARHLKE